MLGHSVMVLILRSLALTLTGLLLGGVSAFWMSGLFGAAPVTPASDISLEGWVSDWAIGSTSANAYTRARVARHGLLALAKEEAVYFIRNRDDDGDPLKASCHYELQGGRQDAAWWSITLYDEESRLPMNDDGALSIDATTVGDADTWTAVISQTRPEDRLWLSSRGAEQFDLTLRLYRPLPSLLATPETKLNPPSIGKRHCGAGS